MLVRLYFDPTTWTYQFEENENTECFQVDMDENEYKEIKVLHERFEKSQTRLQDILNESVLRNEL